MLVVSVLGSGSAGATEGEGLGEIRSLALQLYSRTRCSGDLFVLISVVVTEWPIGLHNVIVKEHNHI